MKRTTIFLDEPTMRRGRHLARRQGMSFAEVIRRAVARYLAEEEGSGSSSLPSVAGKFASGTPDTAERVDELLWADPHD